MKKKQLCSISFYRQPIYSKSSGVEKNQLYHCSSYLVFTLSTSLSSSNSSFLLSYFTSRCLIFSCHSSSFLFLPSLFSSFLTPPPPSSYSSLILPRPFFSLPQLTFSFLPLFPSTFSYFSYLPHFTSHCLILPSIASYYLPLPHITSHCLTVPSTTSSYHLPLPQATSHCLMLPPSPSFYLLLSYFSSFYLILLPSRSFSTSMIYKKLRKHTSCVLHLRRSSIPSCYHPL